METPDLETETYETIPWSHLAPARTPLLTRIAMVVVGLAGAGALSFVLIAVLRDDAPSVIVTIPPGATNAEVVVPSTAASSETVATAGQPDGGKARLYSEADLMAVIPEEEQRIAATRAEWFVRDFFTVDGDTVTATEVRAALPGGLDVVLPHDTGGGISYVEWVGVLAVRADGPTRYAVDVAFRTLAGSGAGPLERQAVRAVRVLVGINDGTIASVLDLPEPIPVPAASIDVVLPEPAEAPDEVVRAAFAAGSTFGSVDLVSGSGVDASGWRFVVLASDASGLQFPLVVRP